MMQTDLDIDFVHLCAFKTVQQEHIYKLMKSDSYSRFIRSSAYQELLQAKKKVKQQITPCLTYGAIYLLVCREVDARLHTKNLSLFM